MKQPSIDVAKLMTDVVKTAQRDLLMKLFVPHVSVADQRLVELSGGNQMVSWNVSNCYCPQRTNAPPRIPVDGSRFF